MRNEATPNSVLNELFWTVFLGMRIEATPWIRPNRHPSARIELFWIVFLGMRNEATPNSVLNYFGDENWSNPWIRPNRHPSARIQMFLRNFLIWEFRSPPPLRCCCVDSWRCCCADSNVRLIWSLDLMTKSVIYFFLIDKITKLVRHKPRAHPTFQ